MVALRGRLIGFAVEKYSYVSTCFPENIPCLTSPLSRPSSRPLPSAPSVPNKRRRRRRNNQRLNRPLAREARFRHETTAQASFLQQRRHGIRGRGDAEHRAEFGCGGEGAVDVGYGDGRGGAQERA